jgi:hypothetical protein
MVCSSGASADAARGRGVFLPDDVGRELDVGRGERRAVVPEHVLAQVQRPHQAVLRRLPALRQLRTRREIGTVVQQAVEDLAEHGAPWRRRIDEGGQSRWLRMDQGIERAALHGAIDRVRQRLVERMGRMRNAAQHCRAEKRPRQLDEGPTIKASTVRGCRVRVSLFHEGVLSLFVRSKSGCHQPRAAALGLCSGWGDRWSWA